MIEFINKYKQAFTVVGAVSVLIICYLQQKELAKLRDENVSLIQHMVNAHGLEGGNIIKTQSLDSLDISYNECGIEAENARVMDSLQNTIDSLHTENYPCQIELNRYQVAYKIFMERNPKAAKQYGTIISEETE